MYTYLFCILFVSLVISQKCTDCNSCAKCSICNYGQNKLVTVDYTHCNNNGAISHGCCIKSTVSSQDSFCDLVLCDALPTENNKQICESVGKSSFVVPSGASSITVQLKDGVFDGNYDCDASGHSCCGGAGKNLCASNGVSQVCQVTFELSDCYSAAEPEPVECNAETCPDLPCASRSCHGHVCKVDEFYSDEHVCRKSIDECDKTEYCEGNSAICPEDLRRDTTPGYGLVCGKDVYLCGIPDKAISEPKKGHHSSYLEDNDKCSLGRVVKFHKLPYPDCTMKCPKIYCPNDHEVSKYIVAKCDATIHNANPWKCDSSHELTDDQYKQKTICPLNPADYYH